MFVIFQCGEVLQLGLKRVFGRCNSHSGFGVAMKIPIQKMGDYVYLDH
ncbi:hypothetical protein [Nostoc sp. LEGE 12450]|nr:hypothetical protein [Nostoc sp. LEGE 12450]MBE8992698.1 hypothetical protein [Nostoc sp. LEGE 12450]